MKVWIVNVGENLPTDGENVRIFRCGILADYLSERGHEVVWWTSTFDHYLKKHRYTENKTFFIKDNYKIRFLHGSGYQKNISLKRLYDHFKLGELFKKLALNEETPDIIISSFPIISLSYEASKYGKKHNIPVILDVRDMWPDIFSGVLPEKLRFIGKSLLYPMYNRTRNAFKDATGITGMTDEFVSWGAIHAKRSLNKYDQAFPFGYERKNYSEIHLKESNEFWDKNGLSDNNLNIAIVSYIGEVLDLNFIVNIAKKIKESKLNSKIFVCGVGPLFERLKEQTIDLGSIKLMGWMDGCQIHTLLSRSTLGVIPYINREDFMKSIPNKVPEYMSQGLPVVTSLRGVVQKMVEINNCGYFVNNADEFIEIVNGIIRNSDDSKLKKKNSQRYFEQNFLSEKVYNKMSDYLEFVANKNQ